MDPRTRADDLDGAGCAVCRRPVPAERIRPLAERDDLVFAELDCSQCGSTGLAIIVLSTRTSDDVRMDVEPAAPIDLDDVVAMRSFLADYSGDLRGLVNRHSDRSGAA